MMSWADSSDTPPLVAFWLFEQPLPTLIIGVVFVSVLAMVWVQTRDRRAIWAIVVAILLTVTGLAIEQLVVTPAEEVADTLHAIARQLERNEPASVLPFLASSNQDLQKEVLHRLKMVEVQSVSIKSNLQVVVGQGRPPRTAEAKFNAVASIKDRQGYGGDFTVPRYVVVQFVKENGSWRVLRYEMTEPTGRRLPNNL